MTEEQKNLLLVKHIEETTFENYEPEIPYSLFFRQIIFVGLAFFSWGLFILLIYSMVL